MVQRSRLVNLDIKSLHRLSFLVSECDQRLLLAGLEPLTLAIPVMPATGTLTEAGGFIRYSV